MPRTGKPSWQTRVQDYRQLPAIQGSGPIVAKGKIFRAFDQDTGRVLWETHLGSPVNGFPITYSANGRQYVAVSTGPSLVSSGVSRLAREHAHVHREYTLRVCRAVVGSDRRRERRQSPHPQS